MGKGLGLLCPQQCSHLADLPVDTGARGATQGSILLHTVTVVPHLAHVTREQAAGGKKMSQDSLVTWASGAQALALGGSRGRGGAAPDGL